MCVCVCVCVCEYIIFNISYLYPTIIVQYIRPYV